MQRTFYAKIKIKMMIMTRTPLVQRLFIGYYSFIYYIVLQHCVVVTKLLFIKLKNRSIELEVFKKKTRTHLPHRNQCLWLIVMRMSVCVCVCMRERGSSTLVHDNQVWTILLEVVFYYM